MESFVADLTVENVTACMQTREVSLRSLGSWLYQTRMYSVQVVGGRASVWT